MLWGEEIRQHGTRGAAVRTVESQQGNPLIRA